MWIQKLCIVLTVLLGLTVVNPTQALATNSVINSMGVSNVTKTGGHMWCTFTVYSGTDYARIYAYRTSDRGQSHVTATVAWGPGQHSFYYNQYSWSAGTQYTYWCQIFNNFSDSAAYVKSYRHFYTLDASGTSPSF